MQPVPSFLDLPARTSKPRALGLTHVLDKGMPVRDLEALLETVSDFVDLWKFGWGTAYLDPGVDHKVRLLKERGICPCTGGTLLEVAWAQGKAEQLFAWAADLGFTAVEVSNGATDMPAEEKRRLIAEAAGSFVVLSEVGSKDPAERRSGDRWAEEMAADLDAGARWVIAEGRESGTVGLYTCDGAVRGDVVSSIVSRVGAARVIFETPRKDQQAWFIRLLGAQVNLGNVIPTEVIGVEALRLGLRADTVDLSCPRALPAGGAS